MKRAIREPWVGVGFIVEVSGRARWCQKLSSIGFDGKIEPARINALIGKFQAMIDARLRLPQILKLLDGNEEYEFIDMN
jgi:hypothetical protein